MKILVILPTLGGGGAEKVHILLANRWADLGHKVTICPLLKSNQSPFEINKKISIEYLNVKRIRNSFFKLKKIFENLKPDATFAAMWPLTLISIFTWLTSGKIGKLFLVEHTSFSNQNAKKIMKTNLWKISLSMRLMYKFSSGVICVSNGVKESLKAISSVPPKKLHTIYNGINLPKIEEGSQRLDEKKINILSIGRLSDDKDYITTLRSIKHLSKQDINVELKIIGEGPNFEDLKKEVQELGLEKNVTFLGFQKNISKFILKCDLLVHSSNFEGFSMAVLEAISFGKNVVSTDTPHGPSEILNNGEFGSLVRIGDYIEMADAIKYRIKNPISSKLLIERSKKFTLDQASKEYLELTS